MPFPKARSDEILRCIHQLLATTRLTDWERDFLHDMDSRFTRYGPKTRLNNFQYRTLNDLISQKLESKFAKEASPFHYRRDVVHADGRLTAASHSLGATLTKIAIVLAGSGYLLFLAIERAPEYLAPLVRASSLRTFSGLVTHVRDGDTIEVNGVPIRFGSLDCAERGTGEGQIATARMRSLIRGQTLTCYLNGRSSYDREIGSCTLSDGRDLAGIMIQEGYCGRFW